MIDARDLRVELNMQQVGNINDLSLSNLDLCIYRSIVCKTLLRKTRLTYGTNNEVINATAMPTTEPILGLSHLVYYSMCMYVWV